MPPDQRQGALDFVYKNLDFRAHRVPFQRTIVAPVLAFTARRGKAWAALSPPTGSPCRQAMERER
jgi:hypothetical protein